MKVTNIKVHLVRTRRNTQIPSPWVLVQVFTDEGLVGLGDATNWPGGTIIKQAIEELSRLVVGEDAFHIEYLYHRMYHSLHQIGQTGAVIAAISGIEIALWDIVGQALGVDIATDVGARYTTSAAIRLGKRLEEIGLLFYEEPVGPENRKPLAVARNEAISLANIPVCVGERRYTRFGFRDLIAAQAVDMIMPDVVCAGGIAETKKIAAMAESYYIQVSPHNPNSPISTLASLHVMANIPNGLVLEYEDSFTS